MLHTLDEGTRVVIRPVEQLVESFATCVEQRVQHGGVRDVVAELAGCEPARPAA